MVHCPTQHTTEPAYLPFAARFPCGFPCFPATHPNILRPGLKSPTNPPCTAPRLRMTYWRIMSCQPPTCHADEGFRLAVWIRRQSPRDEEILETIEALGCRHVIKGKACPTLMEQTLGSDLHFNAGEEGWEDRQDSEESGDEAFRKISLS
jgi:hypothetical protein